MAVTPVLTGPVPTSRAPWPFINVAWPTRIPLTSVIAFWGPGEPENGIRRSRARVLACVPAWIESGSIRHTNTPARATALQLVIRRTGERELRLAGVSRMLRVTDPRSWALLLAAQHVRSMRMPIGGIGMQTFMNLVKGLIGFIGGTQRPTGVCRIVDASRAGPFCFGLAKTVESPPRF